MPFSSIKSIQTPVHTCCVKLPSRQIQPLRRFALNRNQSIQRKPLIRSSVDQFASLSKQQFYSNVCLELIAISHRQRTALLSKLFHIQMKQQKKNSTASIALLPMDVVPGS